MFLLMEHTVVFWVAFVPLVLLFIICMIGYFKPRRGLGISSFIAAMVVIVVIIALLVFVSAPENHKHTHDEMSMKFSFQPENSTAGDYMQPFCRICDYYLTSYPILDTSSDTSYLEAITEHSNASEIVPGEYYTITATVVLADYDFYKTRIRCEVGNENVVVNFSVEFQQEFEEAVGLLEAGDEVTFYGRFYDEGCGFTDSVLVND